MSVILYRYRYALLLVALAVTVLAMIGDKGGCAPPPVYPGG